MSDFHKRTTAELQGEHARIAASSDRGGPVFGAGYWNHGFAKREIESELNRRGITTAVSQAPDNSQTQGWPDPATVYATRAAACQQARQSDDDTADANHAANPTHQALDDLAEQAYAARRGN